VPLDHERVLEVCFTDCKLECLISVIGPGHLDYVSGCNSTDVWKQWVKDTFCQQRQVERYQRMPRYMLNMRWSIRRNYWC